ncbi:MAG: trehalose synthase, partial [Prochlorococcus sp.]|nr:trehalose synthase [Prochlorococcus sp.]
ASVHLDLSRWKGKRTREVLWGCEFPVANQDWFVYLSAYGFSWWLIGEVADPVPAVEEQESRSS